MTTEETLYYNDLKEQFGKLALNRSELAQVLDLSLSFVDKLLREGIGLPEYKRIGRSQKPRIVFPIGAVAKFLATSSTQQGGYFEE